MRTIINLNKDWRFSRTCTALPNRLPADWELVCLPHKEERAQRSIFMTR